MSKKYSGRTDTCCPLIRRNRFSGQVGTPGNNKNNRARNTFAMIFFFSKNPGIYKQKKPRKYLICTLAFRHRKFKTYKSLKLLNLEVSK